MWPMRMGARKESRSIDAVTTGSRAWRIAAMPAARSVHCITIPPNAVPCTFASLGITRWVTSTREADAGFASGIPVP